MRNPVMKEPPYFEIGYTTMTRPSYYLWINCTIETGVKLIKKYKLRKI